MEQRADMLKKITLSITPETKAAVPGMQPESLQYAFIYGIGPQGLAPFEYALAGKAVGDDICIDVNRSNLRETFQHLPIPLSEVPGDRLSASYRIKIIKISVADNREIVAAMARQSSCADCCGH